MIVLACNRCLVKVSQVNQSPRYRRGDGGSEEGNLCPGSQRRSQGAGRQPGLRHRLPGASHHVVFSMRPLEGTYVPFEGQVLCLFCCPLNRQNWASSESPRGLLMAKYTEGLVPYLCLCLHTGQRHRGAHFVANKERRRSRLGA